VYVAGRVRNSSSRVPDQFAGTGGFPQRLVWREPDGRVSGGQLMRAFLFYAGIAGMVLLGLAAYYWHRDINSVVYGIYFSLRGSHSW